MMKRTLAEEIDELFRIRDRSGLGAEMNQAYRTAYTPTGQYPGGTGNTYGGMMVFVAALALGLGYAYAQRK